MSGSSPNFTCVDLQDSRNKNNVTESENEITSTTLADNVDVGCN